MAILSHPVTRNFLSGHSSTASSAEGGEDGGVAAVVHVAVGNSMKKTAALLGWTFRNFVGQQLCLLHVHRPSPLIPTLLGRLPASQASPETVAAFRNEEREEKLKLLSNCLMICSRSKVKAKIVMAEADDVKKEIVDLVNLHSISKLVIGAIPDCMKGKKTSRKASHAAKHVPSYCELWFVKKGKLIWTRQAFGIVPSNHQNSSSCNRLSTDCGYSTSSELQSSSFSSAKSMEQCSCIQLAELNEEGDESENEAYTKLLEYKEFETKAPQTFNKVKAMEMAHSREVKLRIEAEDALTDILQEREKMLERKEKMNQQLQKTMLNIALLDSRAQEANRRVEEVSEELKLIQSSITTLLQEKRQLQLQKIEAMKWFDRWKRHGEYNDERESEFMGSTCDFLELQVFLLSDLETATCNFSESFRIGHGGYGVVYKGELLNRTVSIKILNFDNMQRQIEFHKAVQPLGKLHHPHIVELIGICPESWTLVYEYLPGGSLHNYLSNNNVSSLNWKIRAQMVADIANGLLFLHSTEPKKTIHGNLKPENILLDSQYRCKISDYADRMLMDGQTLRCPSFRHISVTRRDFSYTDPEYYRTGAVTHNSDIYSFGLIILRLVTGKGLGGLIGEVRRAVSNGEVTSVLDLSAGEWSTYVGRRLVELGLQCCESSSRDRLELTRSLVKELERLPFLEDQTVPSFFLCPILREIMHDPQVAADGFTYEGEALHGWLRNGHITSPMTNLKLSHLNLTPNLALRHAIQDWICKS